MLADPKPANIPSRNATVAELLLCCARGRFDSLQMDRLSGQLRGNLDWEAVIEMACGHGVLPLVHQALQRTCTDLVPADVARHLHGLAQENARQSLMLMQELLNLLVMMQSRGLRALPYKGPLLAMLAYGDVSLRQSGDLDILSPQADLPQARKLLESAGYRLDKPLDQTVEQAMLASPHECHYTYIRDDRQVVIELHWRAVGRLMSFSPDPADLWDRSVLRQVAGVDVRVLSPEDTLLLLCAHGMKHFWTRLGWICDVAEFIRAEPSIDWSLLLKRAGELGGRGMVLLGLALAHRVLEAPLPQEVLHVAGSSAEAQAAELAARLFQSRPADDDVPLGGRMQLNAGGIFRTLLFHMRTRESWIVGLRYCFHRLFTPTVLDRNWARLPASLSFGYYLIRPLRLTCKFFQRTFVRLFRQTDHGTSADNASTG